MRDVDLKNLHKSFINKPLETKVKKIEKVLDFPLLLIAKHVLLIPVDSGSYIEKEHIINEPEKA